LQHQLELVALQQRWVDDDSRSRLASLGALAHDVASVGTDQLDNSIDTSQAIEDTYAISAAKTQNVP
jgi:hypothetical protein